MLRIFRSCAVGVCIALAVGGCVTTEKASFVALAGQTALVRDGRPAISSVKKNSLVLLSNKAREIPQGGRVAFVLALQNRTGAPLNFAVSDIEVIQAVPDRPDHVIPVLTFEQLQREERNRQVAQAILVGLAAGANAASASRAGYYRSSTTIYTPRGTLTATTTGYSPAAAAIASANASAENAQMIDSAIQQGQANMARLENEYIKEHTLLPGEWYGGTVAIEPPVSDGDAGRKDYRIRLKLGTEVHTFDVVQEPNKA